MIFNVLYNSTCVLCLWYWNLKVHGTCFQIRLCVARLFVRVEHQQNLTFGHQLKLLQIHFSFLFFLTLPLQRYQ